MQSSGGCGDGSFEIADSLCNPSQAIGKHGVSREPFRRGLAQVQRPLLLPQIAQRIDRPKHLCLGPGLRLTQKSNGRIPILRCQRYAQKDPRLAVLRRIAEGPFDKGAGGAKPAMFDLVPGLRQYGIDACHVSGQKLTPDAMRQGLFAGLRGATFNELPQAWVMMDRQPTIQEPHMRGHELTLIAHLDEGLPDRSGIDSGLHETGELLGRTRQIMSARGASCNGETQIRV